MMMERGYAFELFAEPNPLGSWMKMMTAELGLKQDYLNACLDSEAENSVATMFMASKQGPSFATSSGGVLIEEITKEEASAWRGLWTKRPLGREVPEGPMQFDVPRYPPSRKRLLRQAAFGLSLWNVPGKDLRNNNREFFELLPMLCRDVYEQMVRMLCEPYDGTILKDGARKPRKTSGPVRKARRNMPQRAVRKAMIDNFIEAEMHSMRDAFFDDEVKRLAREGQKHEAFRRVVERYENHIEGMTERDEAALGAV